MASGVRPRRLADTVPLRGDHEADDIGHPVAGLPVQQDLGLAGITAVEGDLRGAEEGRVLFDLIAPVPGLSSWLRLHPQ